jgi:hypothetical protein
MVYLDMIDKKRTKQMQRFSDNVCTRMMEDFAINQDKVEFPEIIVYKGNRLPGDDSDCIGVYDPDKVQILLTIPDGKVYKEYKKFAESSVIGDFHDEDPEARLRVLFYHELAHWMVDYVLKQHTHKHSRAFRVCYAYLRRTYGQN